MEHLAYDIQSGDFGGAGAASRDLKQHLKRIDAESNAVRRAMIAAYEAEMNVVIHTKLAIKPQGSGRGFSLSRSSVAVAATSRILAMMARWRRSLSIHSW